MTNDKPAHPCQGYDAATGDVCIKLETRAHTTGKSFDDVVSWILFHREDPMFERITHIAQKYNHTVDEVVDHITMIHEDWE